MKTITSHLDFWDEPLPAAGVRRLLRSGAAARHARLAQAAPARRQLRRSGFAAPASTACGPRRAAKR